ncbi:hypothetical protein [Demequina sp.]|uniref:hypothetical protein n=1 Tax=Demequina sp. TaxID=2050685 RepID=UPI003D13DE48
MSGDLDSPAPSPVPARRPAGVSFVIVLVWLAAIGDLIGSITLFFMSFDRVMMLESGVDVITLRYYTLVLLALGLATILVALGLGNRSQFARAFVVILMAARAASALWALIAIRGISVWSAVFDLALAVLIIALLTNRSASDYYRGRDLSA